MNETLDKIDQHAAKLTDIAQSYQGLADMARQPDASDAFVLLVDAIGMLTLDQLNAGD
jgi:hypothetical protein